MSGLESRLQGSGDPHTEHAGIYLPGAIFRWRLSVGALRFDSGVDHPGPSQRRLHPTEQCVDTALILAVSWSGCSQRTTCFITCSFSSSPIRGTLATSVTR